MRAGANNTSDTHETVEAQDGELISLELGLSGLVIISIDI
jgi:hypothetical protein